MNTKHHGLWLLSVETLLHNLSPYAAGSAELSNFFQNVVMCIPEEGETACEIINVQTSLNSSLAICNTISNGKCNFLRSSRACLTDMITGNRDSIPLWNVLGAILKDIGNQTHGWTWREDISTTSSILLQNIVLNSTLQLVSWYTLLLCNSDVHSQQNGCRCVDSHGSGNLAQVNLVEENFHISKGVNSNTNLAYLALRNSIIGIITNLSRQVESTRQTSSTGLNQIAITLVGLCSSGETCIHTHSPETTAIHSRLYTTSIWIHTREANFIGIVSILNIQWSVQTLLWQVWTLWEAGNCLLYAGIIFL